MFIDTHAHLFFQLYDDDIKDVINRAKQSGIDFILIPSTDLETANKTIELTKKYENIYGAVGVHPHDTKNWDSSFIPKLETLAEEDKIVAIGEIGLDYYYDYSPKEKQIEAFKSQIELALKLNFPVIIHNRQADKDVLEIVKHYSTDGLKAQFHCFNGKLQDAVDLINLNHFISFAGNITYKKSDEQREILKNISLDHLLLETDSPFLTPMPFRGKRNEPSFIELIAEKIAEIHHTNIDEIASITSLNTFKLFGIGGKSKTAFTYKLHNSLYINITNRCNADCIFCDRKGEAVIAGSSLKMKKGEEPSAIVYIDEIGDPKNYKEIVFCGYGEPTIRWEIVKQISKFVKDNGGTTRLNTNGHGNVINKKNITPEMEGLIDSVSISLNTIDENKYSEIMKLDKKYFFEMIDFAKKSKQYVKNVIMTVVNFDEIDIDSARKFTEEVIGAEFRIRPFF